MKTWNALALLAIAAVTAAGLVACGKTTNSGATAAPPASTCTQSWDGTLRDQYNRTCSNYQMGANTCVNARLDVNTGRYVDINTGAPVNCNSAGFDGYNSVPYYGQYGQQQIQGCQGWSQIYGAQYIPVDFGNGQLVCMNTAYLGQQNPGYNFNQYYYTQQPLYSCQGYDCSGYGGYYNGYQYQGCQSQFNFGYASSGFAIGGGVCL